MPWHAPVWTRWQHYRTAGRLPHALLLTGPEGLGKVRLALALAQSLHCLQLDPKTNRACGHCTGCNFYAAEKQHPDLHRLGSDSGQRQILVDTVRAACADLHLTSHAGGWRVLVIEQADRMNWQAANSLLKTLEEPAASTLLVLTSSAPGRLPATVRGRCQQLAVAPPALKAAQAWLSEQHADLAPATAATLLALAGNAPLAALALHEQGGLAQHHEWRDAWLALVRGRVNALELAAEWHKPAGAALLRWLQLWTHALANWLRLGQASELFDGLPDEALAKLRDRLDADALHAYYLSCGHARRLLDGSVNGQLLLEAQLLAWAGRRIPNVPQSSP